MSPFPQSISQTGCVYWSPSEVVYTELQDYRPLSWTIHVSKLASCLSATCFNVCGLVYCLQMVFAAAALEIEKQRRVFPCSREFIRQTEQSSQLGQIKGLLRSVSPLGTHGRSTFSPFQHGLEPCVGLLKS